MPSPMDAQPDSALVQSALKGDVIAFGRLVERHFSVVYAVALARLRNPDAAEDLAQEVFIRAQLHLRELGPNGNFPGWVVRIARNLAIDWQRRGQSASRLLKMVPIDEMTTEIPDATGKGAREAMVEKEQSQTVRGAIMDLPVDQREVILLHFTEELTQQQIAERLGLHQTTVGRQIQKALKTLRGTLEPTVRDAAATFKPSRGVVAKSLTFVAAIGALSASAKTTLAASATVGQWTTVVQTAEAGVAGAVGVVGFFKSLPALIAGGWKLMATGKGIAAIAAAAVIGAGGIYIGTHDQAEGGTNDGSDQTAAVATLPHDGVFAVGADGQLIELAQFTYEEMEALEDRMQEGEPLTEVFGGLDMPTIPRDTHLIIRRPDTTWSQEEFDPIRVRRVYDFDQIDLVEMTTPGLGEEWHELPSSPGTWEVIFTEPIVEDMLGLFWEGEDDSGRAAWLARFEPDDSSASSSTNSGSDRRETVLDRVTQSDHPIVQSLDALGALIPDEPGIYAVGPDGAVIAMTPVPNDQANDLMRRFQQGDDPMALFSQIESVSVPRGSRLFARQPPGQLWRNVGVAEIGQEEMLRTAPTVDRSQPGGSMPFVHQIPNEMRQVPNQEGVEELVLSHSLEADLLMVVIEQPGVEVLHFAMLTGSSPD